MTNNEWKHLKDFYILSEEYRGQVKSFLKARSELSPEAILCLMDMFSLDESGELDETDFIEALEERIEIDRDPNDGDFELPIEAAFRLPDVKIEISNDRKHFRIIKD